MSGLAEVLLTLGYQVTGSDIRENAVTRRLVSLGAKVYLGHAQENLGAADLVVYSSAISEQNPEMLAAKGSGRALISRAGMLAELMRLKYGIAVAGTHGKTTTTSLIAHILAQAGLDPTYVIGGRIMKSPANARLGAGSWMVAEADESDASFLCLHPLIAVVTNIDRDHLLHYEGDFERLRQAFLHFLSNLPFYGVAVLCLDCDHVASLLPYVRQAALTYGLSPQADVRAENIIQEGRTMRFDIVGKNVPNLRALLNLAGMHNVQNALAAVAVASEIEISGDVILEALESFSGVSRRLEDRGEFITARGGRCALIDDYAHHPTELAAVLAALREIYPHRRILLVFQPHRFSRTQDLFFDFVKVLSTADVLVLLEVYAAGEAPLAGADGQSLHRAVGAFGAVSAHFAATLEEAEEMVHDLARDGDVVLVAGAGSVAQLPGHLMKKE